MNDIRKIENFQELELEVANAKQQYRFLKAQLQEEQFKCEHITVGLKYRDLFPYSSIQYRCLICGQELDFSRGLYVAVDQYFDDLDTCDVAFEYIRKMALELAEMYPNWSNEDIILKLNSILLTENVSVLKKSI